MEDMNETDREGEEIGVDKHIRTRLTQTILHQKQTEILRHIAKDPTTSATVRENQTESAIQAKLSANQRKSSIGGYSEEKVESGHIPVLFRMRRNPLSETVSFYRHAAFRRIPMHGKEFGVLGGQHKFTHYKKIYFFVTIC